MLNGSAGKLHSLIKTMRVLFAVFFFAFYDSIEQLSSNGKPKQKKRGREEENMK